MKTIVTGVAKRGGYRYEDGTRYIGDWNSRGQKHGMGHLILAGKLNSLFIHLKMCLQMPEIVQLLQLHTFPHSTPVRL